MRAHHSNDVTKKKKILNVGYILYTILRSLNKSDNDDGDDTLTKKEITKKWVSQKIYKKKEDFKRISLHFFVVFCLF